jgi:hypothetical protein
MAPALQTRLSHKPMIQFKNHAHHFHKYIANNNIFLNERIALQPKVNQPSDLPIQYETGGKLNRPFSQKF